MNAKKNELLNKLAAVDTSDKWNSIEQSVSTLVRSNPVSTTTDSNLLDGTWQLACQSTNATAVLTLPPPRRSSLSSSANSPTTSAPLITTTATTISLSQSAPSLSKKTGLLLNALAVTQTHTPTALTRTSITTSRRRSLVLCNALTIPLPGKATTLITIHYLDSTLCILQENNVLEVLTTTLPPTSVGAKLRNTQRFLLLPFKYTSPFNLRRKIRASQAKRAAVRALNARQGTPYGIQIGELTKETPYVSVGDDEYNAADDPLGHLAADERQAKMASMSLGELRKLEQERIRNEKARTKRGRG